MSKINRIVNNKTPKNLIKKKEVSDSKATIEVDFRYFMFEYVHCGVFTNFPKDNKQDTDIKKRFFSQFLPHVTHKTFSELSLEDSHNHIIDSDKNKSNVNLIKTVLKTYSEEYGFENLSDTDNTFWQLAAPGGMRVIGFRSTNVFQILFLDPHHLIFKNEIFNQDYSNYIYNRNNDCYKHLSLVHVENCFLEKCIDCKTFDEIVNVYSER